jgi:hypothetical protein
VILSWDQPEADTCRQKNSSKAVVSFIILAIFKYKRTVAETGAVSFFFILYV